MPGTLRALCIKYGAKAAAWTVSVQVPSVPLRCLAQVDVSCIGSMTTLLFIVLHRGHDYVVLHRGENNPIRKHTQAKHSHEKGLGQFFLPVQ